jgi:Holliday junction resolvase-like predicted endonuclease
MGDRNVKTSSATTTKRKTLGISKGKSRQSVKSRQKKGGDSEAADITPEERNKLIAEAAYYRAEQHGFNPERQMDDWLAAEAEVDTMLENITHQVDTEQSH